MATTTTIQRALTPLGTEPITAEQLLEMHARGMRGELIRGVFCPTMSAGKLHAAIAINLAGFLREVVRPGRLGWILGTDGGVRLESNPDTVREPDIAYFSRERLPMSIDDQGYADVAPDIVAEIASPSDSVRQITDKAHMWLNAGVQLVWVLWPETQTIEVHRPNQPVTTLREADTLTAEDILPQFSVPVADIFDA